MKNLIINLLKYKILNNKIIILKCKKLNKKTKI